MGAAGGTVARVDAPELHPRVLRACGSPLRALRRRIVGASALPSPRLGVSSALIALTLLSACASAGQRFDGAWAYRQSCGFGHTVNLVLQQQGAALSGEWDDGTRVVGDSGRLAGDVRGDTATVRLCSGGEAVRSTSTCPQSSEATDALARVGDTLVWSRRSGTEIRPYVTLHRAGSGRTVPVDDRCDEHAPHDASDEDADPKATR